MLKNYRVSFFIYFLIFGLIVELTTLTITNYLEYINIQKEIKERHQNELLAKKHILENLIYRVESSIDSIINNNIFQNFLKNQSSKENKKLVKELFLFTSNENKSYMQVRFLNTNGDEKIRIDRDLNSTNSFVIDDLNLQNKKDRYYFYESIQKQPNEFWFSKLDLNQENGQIEFPFKPTLRIAKPIELNGEKKGIVIINILMEKFLKQLSKSYSFNIHLIDKRGNYIYSNDEKKAWSVDLKNNYNIFKDISLKKDEINQEFEFENVFFNKLNYLIDSQQQIFIVFQSKDEIVTKMLLNNLYSGFWILLFVLFLSIPIAYRISRTPIRLHSNLESALKKLERSQEVVDKHVLTLQINAKGYIKSISEAFSKKKQCTKEELIGKAYSQVVQPASIKKTNILLSKEVKTTDKNGSELWVSQTILPIIENGSLEGYDAFLTDITDKKEIEKRSILDPLTQIYNRIKLDESLQIELDRANRTKREFSLIMTDIDFFKKVNDNYGHQIGDEVLVKFASQIKSNIRKTDILGRFGGEEFIIILPDTNKDGALKLAQKLRKIIENYKFSENFQITASFGVSSYQENDTETTITKRADDALYKAKENGRNQACFGE